MPGRAGARHDRGMIRWSRFGLPPGAGGPLAQRRCEAGGSGHDTEILKALGGGA
jgi:hypothetical protein